MNLILIDEVHLLNSNERGATLEAVIARMKTISQFSSRFIRIIAVSATVPNVDEIGEWLDAKILKYGEEYRPVPLDVKVLGFTLIFCTT